MMFVCEAVGDEDKEITVLEDMVAQKKAKRQRLSKAGADLNDVAPLVDKCEAIAAEWCSESTCRVCCQAAVLCVYLPPPEQKRPLRKRRFSRRTPCVVTGVPQHSLLNS